MVSGYTKKMLSMKERYIVMQYIEAHCTKKPDEQYARYDSIAKNDQHVADLHKPSIPNINVNHVIKMRQEMDLFLEPSRFMTKQKYETSLEDVNTALIKLNEVIAEHEARIAALEDRYTTPKGVAEYVEPVLMPKPDTYPPTIPLTRGLSPFTEAEIEYAAGAAVAKTIDPLLPKYLPGVRYKKGKHSR